MYVCMFIIMQSKLILYFTYWLVTSKSACIHTVTLSCTSLLQPSSFIRTLIESTSPPSAAAISGVLPFYSQNVQWAHNVFNVTHSPETKDSKIATSMFTMHTCIWTHTTHNTIHATAWYTQYNVYSTLTGPDMPTAPTLSTTSGLILNSFTRDLMALRWPLAAV